MTPCDMNGHTWTERGDAPGSARVWCRVCTTVPDLLLAIHERDLLREELKVVKEELAALKLGAQKMHDPEAAVEPTSSNEAIETDPVSAT